MGNVQAIDTVAISDRKNEALRKSLWRVVSAIESQRALSRALRASATLPEDDIPAPDEIADMVEGMAELIDTAFGAVKYFVLDHLKGGK